MTAFPASALHGLLRISRRWLLLLAASVLLHLLALQWATGNLSFDLPRRDLPVTIAVNLPPVPTQEAVSPPAPPKTKPRTVRRNAPRASPAPAAHVSATDSAPPIDTVSAPVAAATVPAPVVEPQETAVAEEKPQAPRYAVDPPPSAELWYDVRQVQPDGSARSGHGSIEWRRKDGAYVISGDVGVLFFSLLSFRSEGAIDEFGISPVLYSEKRFRRALTNTHFHRERNKISFSASENTYPRVGGEQDRASIMWQLAGIGRANAALFSPDSEFDITVAGVRDAEPWTFRVIGREEIKIGIGTLPAWHLMRKPRPGSYEQVLDIWLAPQREWYPVKIRYTETSGSVMEMTLSDMQSRQQESSP